MTDEINASKGKSWGIIAIYAGLIAGVISAVICLRFHLVIFGFNIMYIVSPLLAGFIENFVAVRKYGKSTGAISALLTFILINIYGWLLPGWIFPKEPVTLSLITIIAIILTIQAAFPTFVNHLLLVVVPGIFLKLFGFLLKGPAEIIEAMPSSNGHVLKQADDIFIDDLTIPLISIPGIKGDRIRSYEGLVVGEAIAEEKEVSGRFGSLVKMILPTELADFNLADARKEAIQKLLENAQYLGANAVVEVLIDYVSMGGLQGSVTIVTATGTAVKLEDNTNLPYDTSTLSPGDELENNVAVDLDYSVKDKNTDINNDNNDLIEEGNYKEGETINGEDSNNNQDNKPLTETPNIDNILNDRSVFLDRKEFDVYGLGLASRDVYGEELTKRFFDVSEDLYNTEHGITKSEEDNDADEGNTSEGGFASYKNLLGDDSKLKGQISGKSKDIGNWFQSSVSGNKKSDETDSDESDNVETGIYGKLNLGDAGDKAKNIFGKINPSKSETESITLYGENVADSNNNKSSIDEISSDMFEKHPGEDISDKSKDNDSSILGKIKVDETGNKIKNIFGNIRSQTPKNDTIKVYGEGITENSKNKDEYKNETIFGKVKSFTPPSNTFKSGDNSKMFSGTMGNSKINQDIIGKEVIDDYATLIGKVKDVDVNIDTNTLESLVVGKGGILEGLGSSRDDIIIPRSKVLTIGDKIIIKSSH